MQSCIFCLSLFLPPYLLTVRLLSRHHRGDQRGVETPTHDKIVVDMKLNSTGKNFGLLQLFCSQERGQTEQTAPPDDQTFLMKSESEFQFHCAAQ